MRIKFVNQNNELIFVINRFENWIMNEILINNNNLEDYGKYNKIDFLVLSEYLFGIILLLLILNYS